MKKSILQAMPVLTASQEMKEVALADEPKKETTYYGHTYTTRTYFAFMNCLVQKMCIRDSWFRMAHPNGRMRLTALRITEQMAIFEAKVFLDRSDAEPFSMSTAQQTSQDSRDFVKAAQNEALSQALTDAGFGIQMISAGAQADLMEKSIETPVKKAAEPPAGPAARTAPPQEPHSAPQKGDTPAEGKSPARPIETPQRFV